MIINREIKRYHKYVVIIKKFPSQILYLLVLREIKREHIYIYLYIYICVGEGKNVYTIHKCWGRGNVVEEEETLYVLVIEKCIYNW